MSRAARAARRCAWGASCLLAPLLAPASLPAQDYRLRLDVRGQAVSFRGVEEDSVSRSLVAAGPTGGLVSPDGFAVTCTGSNPFCRYFRPGPVHRAGPVVASADLTLWGLGVTGLRVRLHSRAALDLGDSVAAWPLTSPALQLLEGYAEYATGPWVARAGRLLLADRLGFTGLDGGRVAWRGAGGVEAEAYLGWGLGRAVGLPVSSPALNPLDDFQPRDRQIVAGAAAGWRGRLLDARLDYRREVDPAADAFTLERAAASLALRPARWWNVELDADYDLAQGWVGSAEGRVRYTRPAVSLIAGARRYRPHFDLWTIWGAFSPVPYHAFHGSAWLTPASRWQLRLHGERFVYENSETSTPLVDVEDRGWRVGAGVTFRPDDRWTIDAEHQAEFGPGASSTGLEGRVSWQPSAAIALTAHAATLVRPLELRLSDAHLRLAGLEAEWRLGDRFRAGAGATRLWEDRERPDAAAIDWSQTRLHARVTMLLGSGADRTTLPPARPRQRPRGSGRT